MRSGAEREGSLTKKKNDLNRKSIGTRLYDYYVNSRFSSGHSFFDIMIFMCVYIVFPC